MDTRAKKKKLKKDPCIGLSKRIEKLERELTFFRKKYGENERLAVVVRDSNDAITVQDLQGKITAWNRGAERIYGYTEDEALRLNIFEIVPDDKKSEARDFLDKIANGKTVDSFETQRLTKNGKILDIWLTVTPLFDNAGRITAVATTERDITEIKQTQESLRNRIDTIKLFSYSVFHDLKNPAISIHNLSKRLLRDLKEKPGETVEKYCGQIHKSSAQLVDLVEQLNVFISERETPRTIESVSASELIEIIKDEFASRLDAAKIKLIVPEYLPNIQADRISILRIIRNLIDNALKYGGKELSEIEIGYEEHDQHHVFSIRDNGVGLSEQESAGLFEPFKRYKSAQGVSGSGLGLAIVREIAQQHCGNAWVDLSGSKGITFYFSIAKSLSLSPQSFKENTVEQPNGTRKL